MTIDFTPDNLTKMAARAKKHATPRQFNTRETLLITSVMAPSTPNSPTFLQPNGNGALMAESSASTIGGTRGINAVDLQLVKTAASHVASGQYSSLLGGLDNAATSQSSTVVGGQNNTAGFFGSGAGAAIVGGSGNIADGQSSFIGGGQSDFIYFGESSAILGGENNTIGQFILNFPGNKSAIIAGQQNLNYADDSVVVGGVSNQNTGVNSAVLGGRFNKTGSVTVTNSSVLFTSQSTVGGGEFNTALSLDGAVVSGQNNQAAGAGLDFIGGGFANSTVSNGNMTIGGGQKNIAAAANSTIAGGQNNYISTAGGSSAIGGGVSNLMIGGNSFVAGNSNWVQTSNSTVAGAGNVSPPGQNFVTVFGRGARSSASGDFVVGNDGNGQQQGGGVIDAVFFRAAGDTANVHIGRPTNQPAADVAQTAALTIGVPAVFTVAAAPANGSAVVLSTTGSLPANFSQQVSIHTTPVASLIFTEPTVLNPGAATFTVGNAEQTRLDSFQSGAFYVTGGPAKAVQLYDGTGAGHYFWFNTFNGETDPGLVGTGHEVDIFNTTWTALQVADALQNVVQSVNASFVAEVDRPSVRMWVINLVPGVTTASSATGSAVTVTQVQAGAAGTPVDNGLQCSFASTLSLSPAGFPAGVTIGTNFYVINSTGTSFQLAVIPGGPAIPVAGFQSVTGINFGQPHSLRFSGLNTGQRYYVINSAGTTFNIAYIPGGTAIPTYGTQSGTHTATTKTYRLGTAQNKLLLHTTNTSNQSQAVGLVAPTSLTASWDLHLPTTGGSSLQFLQTDGSGNTTWANQFVSGATGARPVTTVIGYMYFDTSLAAGAGRPVWWNGTTWVDSTGTPA